MRETIMKILKEDVDWIKDVPGTPRGITIIEPKSKSNPKNSFRVYVTHAHGEEGGTWADNWFSIKQHESDKLLHLVNILIAIDGIYNPVTELIRLIIEDGEDWILNPVSNDVGTDYVGREDIISDALYEYLYDYGIISYDSFSQNDAPLERWWITYFDENGIEHKVDIDKNTVWAQRK